MRPGCGRLIPSASAELNHIFEITAYLRDLRPPACTRPRWPALKTWLREPVMPRPALGQGGGIGHAGAVGDLLLML